MSADQHRTATWLGRLRAWMYHHARPNAEQKPPVCDESTMALFDPYSTTLAVDHGPDRLLVDVGKFFDAITELFERFDMARYDMVRVPIGLTDIAESDTWFSVISSGWSEALCQHIAAAAADIVHRRYPAAAGMPLDHRFNLCLASAEPPFEWSYPGGEHMELAKRVVGDHLRGQAQDSYGIGRNHDQFSSIDPLYKAVKSTFEVAVAVIGVAQTHPLYQRTNQ